MMCLFAYSEDTLFFEQRGQIISIAVDMTIESSRSLQLKMSNVQWVLNASEAKKFFLASHATL